MIENSKKIKNSRGRPKTLNKNKVIELAMHAYWYEGPTRVSLNSMCKRAGVSKPSLYLEFGNEDGLVSAALEKYIQSVMIKLIDSLNVEGSFTDKIGRLVSLVAEGSQHEKGCLFVKMRAAKSSLGKNTQALIEETESMALNAYTRFLNESLENKTWSGFIPVELAAQYLHAQIGLAMELRERGEDPRATLDIALSVFNGGNKTISLI